MIQINCTSEEGTYLGTLFKTGFMPGGNAQSTFTGIPNCGSPLVSRSLRAVAASL